MYGYIFVCMCEMFDSGVISIIHTLQCFIYQIFSDMLHLILVSLLGS